MAPWSTLSDCVAYAFWLGAENRIRSHPRPCQSPRCSSIVRLFSDQPNMVIAGPRTECEKRSLQHSRGNHIHNPITIESNQPRLDSLSTSVMLSATPSRHIRTRHVSAEACSCYNSASPPAVLTRGFHSFTTKGLGPDTSAASQHEI